MTVSSSLNRKAYTGDGVTTSFSTSPVVFYDSDELDVYVVTTATGASTTLTENTHYTVSGGSGSTGTVSLAGGSSPYGAPSASQTLVIVRTLDLVQEFDPQNNDGSDADNIERAFDKLTMMAQQNAAAIARAFKLADSDVSGASTEVPTPSASKLIGWNSAGTALENKAAADVDLTIVTAYIQTLLDDADAATAQATLLLGTKSTVACAATTADIWTGTGTLIDFTGSTGPVTDFPDAPRAGIQRVLLCASTPTFTHNASQLVVPGGANYTAAAGDIIIVTAETTTKFRLSIFKADGTAVVSSTPADASEAAKGIIELATQAEVNAMTDTSRAVTPNHNKIVLGTEQASTSGTSIDFTGIPAGVRRIVVNFVGVSTNGTSKVQIQLGTSGGVEATGYSGSAQIIGSTPTNLSAGFLEESGAAAAVRHGKFILALQDSSDNTWACLGAIGRSDTNVITIVAGTKALSAALDRVRVTTVGGTDTFDAGAINISYER